MCYKCGICDAVVKSGPRRVHLIVREVEKQQFSAKVQPNGVRTERDTNGARTEIAREIPVCEGCQRQLCYLKMEGMSDGDALNAVREREMAKEMAKKTTYRTLSEFPVAM